ncbi:hypothetical protein ACQ5SK_38105 [Bradyrhizobium japonicum]
MTENAPVNVSDAVGRENVTPAWACAVTSFPPSDRILSTILTRQAERHGDRVLLVAGRRAGALRRPRRSRPRRPRRSSMPGSVRAIGSR